MHTANSYQYWLAGVALQKDFARLEYNDFKSMDEIEKLFTCVNGLMKAFFEHTNDWKKEIAFEKGGIKRSAKPFKIFSHVITHEFHHKGQILSIGRHLGYIPVDTDILL